MAAEDGLSAISQCLTHDGTPLHMWDAGARADDRESPPPPPLNAPRIEARPGGTQLALGDIFLVRVGSERAG